MEISVNGADLIKLLFEHCSFKTHSFIKFDLSKLFNTILKLSKLKKFQKESFFYWFKQIYYVQYIEN